MEKEKHVCEPKYKKRSHQTTDKHKVWLAAHGDKIKTVLIGTSMFERALYMKEAQSMWKKHGLDEDTIFNCSVGGDRIENILYRLESRKILDSIPSSVAVTTVIIMAGANDVEKGDIDGMISGMEQIIAIVRHRFPHAQLHVLGMYPRRSKQVPEEILLKRVTVFNERLSGIVNQDEYAQYHYFGNDVLHPQGYVDEKFFVDTVHFNKMGYNLMAAHLKWLLKS